MSKASSTGALVSFPWHARFEAALCVHRLVMLVGPPGVGKTTVALAASRRRNEAWPEMLQGSPETELSHLYGHYGLMGGETRFLDGPLTRALRQGVDFVIEEFNLVPLEVRASLLALRGVDSVVVPDTGERLVIPEAFRLIATSNPDSLTCRRQGHIAQALFDDFLTIVCPRLEAEDVERLLHHHFPGENKRVTDVVGLWKRFENLATRSRDDEEDAVRLSYRAAEHLMKLLRHGMEREAAVEVAFVNKYLIDREVHSAAQIQLSLGV